MWDLVSLLSHTPLTIGKMSLMAIMPRLLMENMKEGQVKANGAVLNVIALEDQTLRSSMVFICSWVML